MSKVCMARYFRKSLAFSCVCILLSVLCSCGYSVGDMMHPQIRTIAIADVKNESMEPQASALLRGILAERFQFDNSLKLASTDNADCILYARIVSVTARNVSWHDHDLDDVTRPAMIRLTARIKYTVRIPGQAKELVPGGEVSGSADYQFTHDPAIGRRDGLRQVFLQASDRIVRAVTEGW